MLLLVLFSMASTIMMQGEILPGISVSNIDLSGLNEQQAERLLQEELAFTTNGLITLQYEELDWTFTPNELGFTLDTKESVSRAMSIGRKGFPWNRFVQQLQAFRGGYDLYPKITVDGEKIHQQLEKIALTINLETIEGELSINGLSVSGSDGQIGISLDMEKSAFLIGAQLLKMESATLSLLAYEYLPRILDVSAQMEIANQILSNDLTILPGGNYENNPAPKIISAEELSAMLSIERVVGEGQSFYQIGLDSGQLGGILATLAPQVYEEAENPRFIFNDDSRLLEIIQREIIGRTLEIDASIESINAQLASGQHMVELQYEFHEPIVRENVSGQELGVTELVNAQTTYFYGSSSARMQNIQTGAARFHGLLIPPGAVFSMVENIGDISLDSGFAEALIIYGDRTIKGVGGGICQVSTTLFRTVFYGGFPVVERNPHAYRVYYYELNAAGNIDPMSIGLDATVYAPIVDFKFQNDTDFWLLMETYVDIGARSITWKFYSTSDGREVTWENSGVINVVEAPETIYEENDELEKGEVKQVDYAADGADVSIVRTVTRNGELLFADDFVTHYRPWAAIFQYGPGTPGYPPAITEAVN